MNEDLENARAEAIKKTFTALTDVIENKDKSFAERLEAAAMVKAINQDLIISELSDKGLAKDESIAKKLLDKADKLDGRSEP
jgi:predicted RecB family endonuclease